MHDRDIGDVPKLKANAFKSDDAVSG